VTVNFEFFNMDNCDFHGIRTFFSGSVGKSHSIDVGSIAELITVTLAEDVGTCVKTDGPTSDPYGFAGIVPLSADICKDHKGVNELRKFLLKTVPEALKGRLGKDIESEGTSIVLMERFINLPAELSSPLFKQLIDDHAHACNEDPQFITNKVIISTPIFTELESSLNGSDSGDEDHDNMNRNKVIKKAKKQREPQSEFEYYYGEAELLPKLADYSWDFEVDSSDRVADSKRAFSDKGIKSSRRIFVLTWENFKKFVSQIESYIQ